MALPAERKLRGGALAARLSHHGFNHQRNLRETCPRFVCKGPFNVRAQQQGQHQILGQAEMCEGPIRVFWEPPCALGCAHSLLEKLPLHQEAPCDLAGITGPYRGPASSSSPPPHPTFPLSSPEGFPALTRSPCPRETSAAPQGRLGGEEQGLRLRLVAPFLPGQRQPKKSRQRASLELDGNRPPSTYLGRPTGLVKRKEIHLHLTHMVSS